MSSDTKLFFSAITISFLGSLPLGTLNLSVAGYAFRHDWPGAVAFGIAAILVEMIFVRVAGVAIRRLERLTHFLRFFNIFTCVILLILAIKSLQAASQMQAFRVVAPFPFLNSWLSGLVLSATNPLHLPFWMGWTAVLRSKQILVDRPSANNIFVTAIGLGTAAAFTLYALAGSYLIQLLGSRQSLLNGLVGLALLITAFIQAYKIIFPREQLNRRVGSAGKPGV